jgi:hypothetical protein
VPEPVLTLLKYVFLAVLYLFFLRVLRAVWVELKEPKVTAPPPAGSPGGGLPPVSQASPPGPLGPEKLVVVTPADMAGLEFPLGQEMTVGRAGGCAIMLGDDSFVSQIHARLYRRNGDLFVEDLGSTNGTFLNKRRVSAPVRLRKGDRLQFGRTVLELRK